MSLHPSLKIDTAGVQKRTVFTRIERLKGLRKKEQWKEGDGVTALPKTKVVKVKAKRTKKKEDKDEKK